MVSCGRMTFGDGLLVSEDYGFGIAHVRDLLAYPECKSGVLNHGLASEYVASASRTSRISSELWRIFNSMASWNHFTYGIVPIVYAISALAVITWFLSLFVLTSYTIRPTKILRILVILALVYMLVVIVKSILQLHRQHARGYFYGAELLDFINGLLAINIIDIIVITLLQISQVQVIMRLFAREADKRITLFVGVFAVITSQIIWGITRFYPFNESDEAREILPAFIYLVRIVINLCYLAVILVQFVVHILDIVSNRQIWLLSALTIVFLYSPVAMFIADVSNSFVYAMTEIFLVVTNVVCVVLPWEWCNRFSLIMKHKEREGVLGRKVYDIGMNRLEVRGHDERRSRRGDFLEAVHWKFANVDLSLDDTGNLLYGWTHLKKTVSKAIKKHQSKRKPKSPQNGTAGALSRDGDQQRPPTNRNVYVYAPKTIQAE